MLQYFFSEIRNKSLCIKVLFFVMMIIGAESLFKNYFTQIKYLPCLFLKKFDIFCYVELFMCLRTCSMRSIKTEC